MVLLPEERGMTLVELRQIAARQQHQIEAQQQLLVAKEQRLKFLKQQEARHHAMQEQQLETNCLLTLRDKVEAQELKLRQLRALRGQVDQQKTNNGNLGTELESIRALFCEKEKELDLAVSKVEELSRQLDEIRKNSRKSCLISSTSELENLRRELLYRTKLSEQQNNYVCQQREKIANRQQDISILDQKINDLNKRLHSKRLLNEQFASQIHVASLSRASNGSALSSGPLLKNESRSQELLDTEHSHDDFSANLLRNHKSDLGEFSLTKKDPKYQTLPYNTKFTLKDKQQSEDSLSSSTEDESWSSKSEDATGYKKDTNGFSNNMCNFSPRPFNSATTQKASVPAGSTDVQQVSNVPSAVVVEAVRPSNISQNKNPDSDSPSRKIDDIHTSEPTSQPAAQPPPPPQKNVKPAVPPKPALSVKPMLVHPPSLVRKDQTEPDTVSKALTFLKNKSSEKEKTDFSNYRERLLYYQCVSRYPPSAREPSQDPLLPKSRILTYFSKTLLQPEGTPQEQTAKVDQIPLPKRKSSFGQLPIKPKPLTIRKTPGIEPPKLKVQPVATLTPHRKIVESQSALPASKVLKHLPSVKNEEKSCQPLQQKNVSEDTGSTTYKSENGEDNKLENAIILIETCDPNQAVSESKAKNEETETGGDEVFASDETDEHHRLNAYTIKKGNLKCEGTMRGSRRVSFDPLALLLDAALEGELELVKKTANEVVNPSAANDEGITALHNAICAGHFDVVKFLVEFGCDVNAQDSDGWTPLHCAASCNNLAMVKFLVERGACIFATTLSDQETAAEKCEEDEEGFDGCSEYLFSLQENLGIINNGVVFAVYDYDVQNPDELSFRNGDTLTVLRRTDNEENEWWWSRLHDEEGYVPRNLLGLYPRVTCVKDEQPS